MKVKMLRIHRTCPSHSILELSFNCLLSSTLFRVERAGNAHSTGLFRYISKAYSVLAWLPFSPIS